MNFKLVKDKTYFCFNAQTLKTEEEEYQIALTENGLDIYSNKTGFDTHVIIELEDEILKAIEIIEKEAK